jgi:type IV pilus assembly protein PilA
MNRLQKRLNSEEGFTLIELLVVMIIIGILIAIAVPSYLAFRGTAQDTKGKADVRAAVPDAEEWFSQKNTYTGMDVAPTTGGRTGGQGGSLVTLDSGLGTDVTVKVATGGLTYCLEAPGQGTTKWYYEGPGGGTAGGVTSTAGPDC